MSESERIDQNKRTRHKNCSINDSEQLNLHILRDAQIKLCLYFHFFANREAVRRRNFYTHTSCELKVRAHESLKRITT